MSIKPKALQKNDTVSLIAPAGACKKEHLNLALAWLCSMGFQPVYRKDLYDTLDGEGYLAGDDQRRLEELHQAFLDPKIKGILCLRGGYGSLRLLPKLDRDIISRNPKVFIGYSDITSLLNFMTQSCGVGGFHGPMPSEKVKTPAGLKTTTSLLRAITGSEPRDLISDRESISIAGGRGRGTICGGCLSLVVHTLGTPYEIDTRDKILFLEDIGEEPYRIDRLLTHLKLAGKLDNLQGLAFGKILRGKDESGTHLVDSYEKEIIGIIKETVSSASYPVVYGLPAGHGTVNLTIPFGIQAELDAVTASLRILETAVR